MMQIWVGITNPGLTSLDQAQIQLTASAPMAVSARGQNATLATIVAPALIFTPLSLGVHISTMDRAEEVLTASLPIIVKAARAITVESLQRAGRRPTYQGEFRIDRHGRSLRLSVRVPLDQYLRGVLASEMPASYHVEALKCQALAARTYALNPRISHVKDGVSVCDSYLCCQYFAGTEDSIAAAIESAIESTTSQVIVCKDKPILALFSASAGGHTESYQNCFSDPVTGRFPPQPISYLTGVPEGNYARVHERVGSEAFLRYLFQAKKHNDTALCADLFSAKFAWSLTLPVSTLEAHLHDVVEDLLGGKDSAPFVIPPPGGKFGRIRGFEVSKRGVSGVAIELKIKTSHGDWLVQKELLIRTAFANPEARLARLNSARIFFDQEQDRFGLLSHLTISGLGSGHGVGMQQIGAQGFASQGQNYKQILAHYYPGTNVQVIN